MLKKIQTYPATLTKSITPGHARPTLRCCLRGAVPMTAQTNNMADVVVADPGARSHRN